MPKYGRIRNSENDYSRIFYAVKPLYKQCHATIVTTFSSKFHLTLKSKTYFF